MKTRRTQTLLRSAAPATAVLCLLALACNDGIEAELANADMRAEEMSSEQVAGVHSSSTGGYTMAAGRRFKQFVNLNRVTGGSQEREYGVLVINRDEDPETGRWITSELWLETSFEVLRVTAREANDLVVLGRNEDGSTLLERWIIQPQVGSNTTTRPIATTPLGVPYNGMVRRVELVEGGTWLAPFKRSWPPTCERTLVEIHPATNPVALMVADPDGRYIAIKDSYGFRQIGFDGDGFRSLAEYTALSADAPEVSNFYARQHPDHGRMLIGEVVGSADYMVAFLDADNDGVFESRTEHDHASFKATYGSYSVFVDDF